MSRYGYRRTERHQKILRLIYEFLHTHDYAISVSEIGSELHLTSKQTVHKDLVRMREEGLIQWKDKEPRTLHLTPKGKEMLL
jgi:SOS-response transcriptional repressor LexA